VKDKRLIRYENAMVGNYYMEKIEYSLRNQWMNNDFTEHCVFLLSLNIITSDFEIALIAKGVA